MQALGYSTIGGGIMIIAQNLRLSIIQIYKGEVFIQDVVINIIILTAIPVIFFLFREPGFIFLFLISSILHLVFYTPLFYKLKLRLDKSKKI